jgi:hypothetical protein
VKAVVDTTVVAYLLLGTDGSVEEAITCFNTVSNPIAPAHWEAELTNVVWMAVRSGRRSRSTQSRQAAGRRISEHGNAVPRRVAPIRGFWRRRLRHTLRRTGGPHGMSLADL